MAAGSYTLGSVPLYAALNTKVNPQMLGADSVSSRQNLVFPAERVVHKRFGQTLLSQAIAGSTSSISAATSFGVFNSEMLLFDGSQLYSYGPGGSNWVKKGALTESQVTDSPVLQNPYVRTSVTSYVIGTIGVFAWEDSRGGVRYSVQDLVSKAFYIADQVIDPMASRPRFAASGNFLNLFYALGSNIYARQLPVAAPAQGFGSNYVIATDYNPGGPLDVAVFPSVGTSAAGRMVLAYQTYALTQVNLYALGGNLVLQFQANNGVGSAPVGITVSTSSDANWALWGYVSATTYAASVTSPTFTGGGTISGSGLANVNNCTCAWLTPTQPIFTYDTVLTSTAKPAVTFVTGSWNGTAYAAASTATAYGVNLSSAQFVSGGNALVVAASPSTLLSGNPSAQSSYYLLNSAGQLLLRFLGDEAYAPVPSLSQPTAISSNSVLMGLPQRLELRATSTNTIYTTTGVAAVTLSFPSPSVLTIQPFNSTAIINCGITYSYDGANLVESGFFEFPEAISAAAGPVPGLLGSGQYQYVVVYEWTDIAGNVHRSAPSFPLTYSTVGLPTPSVSLTLPTTSLTRRTGTIGDISITIYRTTVSGAGPWFQIGTISNASAFSGTAFVTYTDAAADASIIGMPLLYAPPDGSGELENDPPPSFQVMTATKTRVFGIPAEDPTALWYSKPLVPNRPAQWNLGQVVRVESAGGAVTALGALDTQAVIFKQTRMYSLTGDGPSAAGLPANGFSDLQLISTVSGCSQPASIASTDQGLVYQAPQGLELLSRNLTIDYTFGFPVDAYSKSLVTAAVSVPSQSHIRFLTNTPNTSMVYDYTLGQWCGTFTNYDAIGGGYWQGNFVRARSNGQVWVENTASYLDNGVPYSFSVETGWLKPTQIAQAFARFRRFSVLGSYKSSHLLNIDIALNYKDYSYTITWNPQTGLLTTVFGQGTPYGNGVDQTYGGQQGGGSAYQLRARMPVQKCEAVRFRIRDSQVTGESCNLSELALELAVMGGLMRLPSGQTL